jgi:hypothetical protein
MFTEFFKNRDLVVVAIGALVLYLLLKRHAGLDLTRVF